MDEIAAYQANAVTTQSRGRLIVLLYEGAIRFLKQAIQHIEEGDWVAKGKCITKAMAIIDELDACLDMEAGGEIAQNLRSLYAFALRHLHEANLKRDPQRIRDVVACLEDLNEGWKAITA
jgi:flagellar protein FliS